MAAQNKRQGHLPSVAHWPPKSHGHSCHAAAMIRRKIGRLLHIQSTNSGRQHENSTESSVQIAAYRAAPTPSTSKVKVMVVTFDPASARHTRAKYIERERVVRGMHPPCGVLSEAPSQSTCTSCHKGDDASVDEDPIALASPTLRRTAATLRSIMLASTCDVAMRSANVALAHRANTTERSTRLTAPFAQPWPWGRPWSCLAASTADHPKGLPELPASSIQRESGVFFLFCF